MSAGCLENQNFGPDGLHTPRKQCRRTCSRLYNQPLAERGAPRASESGPAQARQDKKERKSEKEMLDCRGHKKQSSHRTN
eukprot:1159674-Pelagomonas_calceolata.AAC.11